MMGALEYLRLFWWFAAIIPLFGLFAVIVGSGAVRAVGAMALLWPITIPSRSLMATGRAGRMFSAGCHMEADDENVTFSGNPDRQPRLRFVLPMSDIRDLLDRGDYLLLRTRRFGFVPIPLEAFDEGGREAFEQLVGAHSFGAKLRAPEPS
jgi:hypothetical protein